MRRWSRAAALSVAALVIAGCGNSSSSNSSSQSSAKPASSSAPAASTKGSIAIGALTSLTGAFTPWGLQVRDGMQFAVNEINASGGVKGRKLQLFVADDQSSPASGIQGFRQLTEQDRVLAVGGVIDSDVGVAVARLAESSHIPTFMEKAGSSAILTLNSRYTFRTCLPAGQEAVGPFIQYAHKLGMTRIGAIIADYAWGHAIQAGLQTAVAAEPGMKLKVEVAPVDTTDFTTYLRGLSGFKPQMIVATGHPPGTPPIIAQSAQLGINVPVTGPDFPFSLIAKSVGKPAFGGHYLDFKCMNVNAPGYQSLARKFLKAFPKDGFFEDDALAGYATVHVLADAIDAVGADPAKVAAYLHAHSFTIPGFTYPLKWTSWGELADAKLAIDELGNGPAPAGLNTAGTWFPKQLFISSTLTPLRP
ncbi:MAG: ABC transporter substrate-binding protein [Solirubrobacteraceae bacterium]